MLKNQLKTYMAILKDKDIRAYAGESFWGVVKAIVMGDLGALLDTGKNIKELVLHTPTVLFWDKMQRYLYGTFCDFEEQVKLSKKFENDDAKYEEFVKRQIHLINEIDDDKKIDYFAKLTRSFLLTDLETALFFKLAKFLDICTPEELEYIRSCSYNYSSKNTALISSLYQYGLFSQVNKENGKVSYALSDFAKALKRNCLNYGEEGQGGKSLLSYDQLSPLNIAEPTTWEDIQEIFKDEVIIDGNGKDE